MAPVPDIVLIRHSHHHAASGLDRILEHLDAPYRRVRAPSRPYPWTRALLEAFTPAARPTFYLYGESSYLAGRLVPGAGRGLGACFHHPPRMLDAWSRRRLLAGLRRRGLSQLSEIVVLSEYQAGWFEGRSQATVSVLRHGVDTVYFSPANGEERRRGLFLVVGQWLRDWETLAGAAERVAAAAPGARFIVVSGSAARDRLAGTPALEVHTGVSDRALLDLYRTAELVVLPLVDATANNALLEAMACGAPAVVTDVGGVGEYTGEQGALRVPARDARALARGILALHDQASEREALGLRARRRALRFAWPEVAPVLSHVLDRL